MKVEAESPYDFYWSSFNFDRIKAPLTRCLYRDVHQISVAVKCFRLDNTTALIHFDLHYDSTADSMKSGLRRILGSTLKMAYPRITPP